MSDGEKREEQVQKEEQEEEQEGVKTVVDEKTGERWVVDATTGERTRRWHPSTWIKVDFVRQCCADAEAAAAQERAAGVVADAATRAEREQLAYVAAWTRQPFVFAHRDAPHWRTLLNNSGLKKEVNEAYAVALRVEQLVAELCGGDYARAVVFDVCCGKGYLGATLAAMHPALQVRMTDRNTKINFAYLRDLPNAAAVTGNILKPRDWLARWIRAELRDAEALRRGEPSRLRAAEAARATAAPLPTRRALRAAEYSRRRAEWHAARAAAAAAGTDFVAPAFPPLHDQVRARLVQQQQQNDPYTIPVESWSAPAPGGAAGDGQEEKPLVAIIVGIHLCGLLSEKLVETFNELECVQGLVLCPCCLAGYKVSDVAARSHRLMATGTVDNYIYWALTLYHQVRRDCRKTLVTDPCMITKKNRIILATKRPAFRFDENGKPCPLPGMSDSLSP